MKLPDEIFSSLNLSVSCHKHPEDLDWSQTGPLNSWMARDGSRVLTIVYSEKFGYVISETRVAIYGIGADLK